MDLKNLELTIKDFDLIVKSLEAFPDKDRAEMILMELTGQAVLGDASKERFKSEFAQKRAKADRERVVILEEVRILQGKLLMLKRYMEKNNFLAELDDLTGKKS